MRIKLGPSPSLVSVGDGSLPGRALLRPSTEQSEDFEFGFGTIQLRAQLGGCLIKLGLERGELLLTLATELGELVDELVDDLSPN